MTRIVNAVRFGLGLSWVLATSSVLVTMLIFMLPFRGARIRLCNMYGKFVSPFVLWMCKANVVYHDLDRVDASHPAIYISNHTSVTDIFLAMLLCPVGGVGIAKKEIARVPFYGWAYALSGHLLVDRENREKAIAGMKDVVAAVRKHGTSIWIWPEGTRSRTGRLLPLKKGFAHLAIATGLPIVPILVLDAHKNWPKKSFQFVETTVNVHVLEPIDTSSWTIETLEQHVDQTYQLLCDALPERHRPLQLEAS
ncbi:MAG: 1-acyl-sn-glycerol-3-phosphate acyltransferase [Proteobacteria bacterium]|nr:1-acyl-sn-glycerol-3-phosphate acyltransferase [Pseudomonadota bacterium]MCP4919338.1 1-acyl-sn-glycerol-3-phosphate acyltransferase [Pseudomonadota bacterium]